MFHAGSTFILSFLWHEYLQLGTRRPHSQLKQTTSITYGTLHRFLYNSDKFSMNSLHVIFRCIIFSPWRSVFRSIIAQVNVWTESWDRNHAPIFWSVINTSGFDSKYRLEKCNRTLSRSWVSPVKQNWHKNRRSEESNVLPLKSKNLSIG